jgi:hypothetical protein
VESSATQEIKVHSQRHCLTLSNEEMTRIQDDIAVSIPLDAGIHLIKLRHNPVEPPQAMNHHEPSVLFWIYGGPVINRSTDTEVTATWASLQGYEDVLALDVKNSAKLCALFLDTEVKAGKLLLSVAKI